MNELIGYNDELNKLLNNFKSNNLHNSIIIHGPKGIGKRLFVNSLIHNFFKSSNIEKTIDHHINLFNKESHPNIKIITKIIDTRTKKLKSNITIDQIRNLKKFVTETSSLDNLFKILIIDAADDFNISSANSFLKTLEEPKRNTYIFLITHQISSLLPTLRSRCLKLRLKNHNFKNFHNILTNNLKDINIDESKFLYEITNGSPGNAITNYDTDMIDLYNNTIKCLTKNETSDELIELSNKLSKFDNEKFKNYISIFKSILLILNKFKLEKIKKEFDQNHNFDELRQLSKELSIENIINKLEFLSKNEKELFTFNIDKRLFMLNLLNN